MSPWEELGSFILHVRAFLALFLFFFPFFLLLHDGEFDLIKEHKKANSTQKRAAWTRRERSKLIKRERERERERETTHTRAHKHTNERDVIRPPQK